MATPFKSRGYYAVSLFVQLCNCKHAVPALIPSKCGEIGERVGYNDRLAARCIDKDRFLIGDVHPRMFTAGFLISQNAIAPPSVSLQSEEALTHFPLWRHSIKVSYKLHLATSIAPL
jgi:hypothetical protein